MTDTFKGPSGRTRKYYWWRFYEYFGLPYPKDNPKDTVYHESMAMTFEQIRESETGTEVYAIVEAGSMSPQFMVQITPLYWGFGFSVGDGRIAWRIGPVALKLHYGPMFWKVNCKKGTEFS